MRRRKTKVTTIGPNSPAVPLSWRSGHGKFQGKPALFHATTPKNAKTIFEVSARLKKAGVLVPHVEYREPVVIYEKIGSKRKGYRKNDLTEFLVKFYETRANRQRPNVAKLNKLLTSLAISIAKTHVAGIAHGNVHFSNVPVAKNRVGLVDHRLAEIETVDWHNPHNVYGVFENDYRLLSESFIEIARFFQDPKIQRSLLRRRAWFFDKLLLHYPLNASKREVLKTRINKNYAIWSRAALTGKIALY